MGEFLGTLRDSDLGVRRVALVAFNSAAHNKPSLIRDLLDDILPQLYAETKVKVKKTNCIITVNYLNFNNHNQNVQYSNCRKNS